MNEPAKIGLDMLNFVSCQYLKMNEPAKIALGKIDLSGSVGHKTKAGVDCFRHILSALLVLGILLSLPLSALQMPTFY